eukprot:1950061-Rhodomonas_salina.3
MHRHVPWDPRTHTTALSGPKLSSHHADITLSNLEDTPCLTGGCRPPPCRAACQHEEPSQGAAFPPAFLDAAAADAAEFRERCRAAVEAEASAWVGAACMGAS